MLMVVSVLGARFVPSRVRLYLALAITFAIMPMIPKVATHIELLSITGLVVLIQQVIIGIAIGLITQFVTQTFVLLGQIIGMQSSLGFAAMVDPSNGQNTPLLGQFYLFITTLLFLSTNGHLQILYLVSLSFKTLPIGDGLIAEDFYHLVGWFGLMFKVALSMALAAIIALLTVNISFGVMTRAAPQLNIFSLGFAFTLLIGLFLSLYLLNNILPFYQSHWQEGINSICHLIKLTCN